MTNESKGCFIIWKILLSQQKIKIKCLFYNAINTFTNYFKGIYNISVKNWNQSFALLIEKYLIGKWSLKIKINCINTETVIQQNKTIFSVNVLSNYV